MRSCLRPPMNASQWAARAGLDMLDRRPFFDLHYDAQKYQTDAMYRQRYQEVEALFVKTLAAHTNGAGAAIFIDNIGDPVFRATLKALAGAPRRDQRPVVGNMACKRPICGRSPVSTATSMFIRIFRVMPKVWPRSILPTRRVGCRRSTKFMRGMRSQLAADYEQGRIASYFPIFTVDSTNCL